MAFSCYCYSGGDDRLIDNRVVSGVSLPTSGNDENLQKTMKLVTLSLPNRSQPPAMCSGQLCCDMQELMKAVNIVASRDRMKK